VLLAWLGTLSRHRARAARYVREHRAMLGAVALLFVWLALSLAWAPKTSEGAADLALWALGGLTFLVVAMVMGTRRTAVLVCAGFVAGAFLAATYGLIESGLRPAQSAIASSVDGEDRLGVGGAGDPNYFAAMLVPAIALAIGLGAFARSVARRALLVAAIAVMTTALVATQSRGGLIAVGVALLAALVLLRGSRLRVLMAVTPLLAVGALWFVMNPAAFERVTQSDGGGTGRSELWDVAWEVVGDHPVVGVGLNNFRTVSGRYVRRPQSLEFAELINERPIVVHNVYLQLLAETGIVGLSLFLILAAGCLRSGWRAAATFERAGDRPMAGLARAAVVGTIGTLTTSFFLSNGADRRLWVLLALGPALLVVARGAQEAHLATRSRH